MIKLTILKNWLISLLAEAAVTLLKTKKIANFYYR